MIPNITRGGDMQGVVEYLAGPGNTNEHENPTLIAASLGIATEAGFRDTKLDDRAMQHALAERAGRATDRVGARGQKTRPATGEMEAAHVWHCSLTLAPGEKLTDSEWNRVGQQFVKAMKFDGCEWALVKHGATGTDKLDHAHLVVNLVQTETGKPASVHNDFKRAQAACAKIARELGLTELAGQQRHLPEPDRREIPPRLLTQGYPLRDRQTHPRAARRRRQRRRKLAGRRTEIHPAKRGGALALLERRDVAIPASDLQARINEHMAALELERVHSEPRLTPARHQSEQDYEDDYLDRSRNADSGEGAGSDR